MSFVPIIDPAVSARTQKLYYAQWLGNEMDIFIKANDS